MIRLAAVAAFCHNTAHNLPIQAKSKTELELVYIDDLVDEMLCALGGGERHVKGYGDAFDVPISYMVIMEEYYKWKKNRAL